MCVHTHKSVGLHSSCLSLIRFLNQQLKNNRPPHSYCVEYISRFSANVRAQSSGWKGEEDGPGLADAQGAER